MSAHAARHHVPNYDIYGHQHNRSPFKDKGHLLDLDVRHPKWLSQAPDVRSRSDLHQSRHRSRVPDSSYDFDGDGVVGQLDHFIGRCFDKDNDGSLTKSERLRAKEALNSGFLNKYTRGLDATGDANRGCAVRQRRGVIMTMDNTQDASAMTYQPHFNSHVQPPHATRTALQLSRTAEAKAAGNSFAEKCVRAPAEEPAVKNHRTHPRTCPIENVRERAEADHQAARTRAGLLPQNTAVNPERELKAPGLSYVEQPAFATRGQLVETRKELMKQDCEELALKGLENSVPLSVRRTEQDSKQYEFRRPDHVPMTLTRMKEQRKHDRIKHDMQHFAAAHGAPKSYPRFSDNPEVPFWLADKPQSQMGATAPAPAMSRHISEPALKVGHAPFAHEQARQAQADIPQAVHSMAMAGKACDGAEARLGSRTVKRWTAEMIERGEGRNKPRLFDNIQPVRIGPLDLQSLDHTSSFELVRKSAMERLRGDLSGPKGHPMTSRLWSDPVLAQRAAEVSAGGHSADVTGGMVGERKSTVLRVPAKVHSEPALGTSFEKAQIPNEPKFFGSAAHIVAPNDATAVRCGGFHRLSMGATQGMMSSPQRMAGSKPGSSQQHKSPSFTKGGEQAMAA